MFAENAAQKIMAELNQQFKLSSTLEEVKLKYTLIEEEEEIELA